MYNLSQEWLAKRCKSRALELQSPHPWESDLFLEMIKLLTTTLGLVVVNRHNRGDQTLNSFISSGRDFHFEKEFRLNLLRSCWKQFSAPDSADQVLQIIESAIDELIQNEEIEIEGMGIFKIKMIPVWSFEAGKDVSLPPKVLERKIG
jgi:hypothetical protein